jgi:hypothetical protein
MLIYNVTTHVNWPFHDAWVKWMKEKHIPDVMSSGCFTEYRFVRVLEIDESEGPTYAVQYFAPTKEQYENYLQHHAPKLRNEVLVNWGDHIIGFRSLMELVNCVWIL